MSLRGKRSSKAALVLAIVAALAGWLTHTRAPSRRSGISLPPVEQRTPLAEGKARITKIVDGDTVHAILPGGESGDPVEETIRLYGLNAPELHPRPGQKWADFTVQPCAQEANDFLERLCPAGSEVRIEAHGRDKYGRLLAVLILPDGRDANKLLIEAGLARAYFVKGGKNDPVRLEYEHTQDSAQSAKRGIWK